MPIDYNDLPDKVDYTGLPDDGNNSKISSSPAKAPIAKSKDYTGIFSGDHPFIELLPKKSEYNNESHDPTLVNGVTEAIQSGRERLSNYLGKTFPNHPFAAGAIGSLAMEPLELANNVLNNAFSVVGPKGNLRALKSGEAELPAIKKPNIPSPVENVKLSEEPISLDKPPEVKASIPNEEQLPLPINKVAAPIETEIKPTDKLLQAIKDSVPLNEEQANIYSKERAAKIGNVKDIKTEGEQGYFERLGALKGEHTKVEIDPLRNKLEQSDVDSLFSQIQNHPINDEYAKINASSGLSKLLNGEVPQPSELRTMRKIFGDDVVNNIDNMLPKIDQKRSMIAEGVNLPRALMASVDMSAPLRQGLPLIHKGSFWTSLPGMVKSFGSEKIFQGIQSAIKEHPEFEFSQVAGVKLSDLENLSNREEALMSTWAEQGIPLPTKGGKLLQSAYANTGGKAVRASNRAYVGFLNKLRFDTFNNLIQDAEKAGLDPKNDLVLSKNIAQFVNTATGRGDLGRLEKNAVALNSVFFSPRLIASRVNMLNPNYYYKLDPFTRKEALKSILAVASAGTLMTGVGKLAGAEVELDPRSSDFMKAKFGNTRLDPFGGFQQYIVAASKLVSGSSISPVSGKESDLDSGKFGAQNRFDILQRFGEQKLNPAIGLAIAFLRGKEVTGEKFSWPSLDNPLKNSIAQRFIPLFLQDLKDIQQDDPSLIPLAIPSWFGMGTQTFGGE